MSARRKRAATGELDGIEEALVQSILDADPKALREELEGAGLNPDRLVAEFDEVTASARSMYAKQRLARARSELAAFRVRRRGPTPAERAAARNRLDKASSGDPDLASKMMMAARKGEGLSESDVDGLVDDIAELRRLEDDEGA
jgi:hypothetical protein